MNMRALLLFVLFVMSIVGQTKTTADQLPTPGTSMAGFVWLIAPTGIPVWGIIDSATLEIDWAATPPILRAKPYAPTMPTVFDSVLSNGTWSMPQDCAVLLVFRGLAQKPALDYTVSVIAGEQKITFSYPVASADPVRILCFRK